MLSAQKQQMPSETTPESTRPPTATGFGKVLNSIQGLQQRLDDFSVEEVSRAHAKAHTLIRELDDLQAQLNALAKLKDAVLSVKAEIAAIPADNFDLVGPDSLDKHPQLRAIVQAGKLIRMHRLLRAAQASAESSFDFPTSMPGSEPSPRQTETVSTESSSASEQIPQSPLSLAISKVSLEAEQPLPAFVLGNSPVARESKATPTYDFADLKLEETREIVSLRKDDSSQPNSSHKHAPSRKSKKPKGKPQIDQRLLSNLIETYGEFAISTKPAAPAESIETPPAAVVAAPATSTDLVPVESKPAAPAFVQPAASSELLGLPAPEQERREPVFDEPSPSVKSQGEIDRQLKNIIKDYGEYDLYSDRKTIHSKTAVIAAVAGLALLLGGFYFFKAPSASTPAAVEATTPGGNSAAEVNERPSSGKQNLK